MVRPWAVSSMPIPASSVHGSWYSGRGRDVQGLDGRRDGGGRGGQRVQAGGAGPRAGRTRSRPPRSAGTGCCCCWRRGATARPSRGAPWSAMNGTGSTGVPLRRISKWRWLPVEVPVEPSMPRTCPTATAAPGADGGVDAGEVGVPGGDAAAVVDVDGVAVPATEPGRGDRARRCGDDRAGRGQGGQVYPGVQLPDVLDRVEPHPERRGAHVRLLERWPPRPADRHGGRAVQSLLLARRRG